MLIVYIWIRLNWFYFYIVVYGEDVKRVKRIIESVG